MSTAYHVYSWATGGASNYSTPIASTASLTYNVGPLAYNTSTTFAVRAYDTVSGLVEGNVDARVILDVSPSGVDLGSLPNSPTMMGANPQPSATVSVSWAYSYLGQGAPPTGFHIYVTTPTISYTSPQATVAYIPGTAIYNGTVSGLTGGSVYQVAVRAYNSTGEDSNTIIATFTAASSGPNPVTGLTSFLVS